MKNLLLVSLLAMLQTPSTELPRHASSEQVEFVSMLQLIATPEKYDGKVVEVVGFLRLEFEGHILYLHEADYENGITKNGIWVVRSSIVDQMAETLNMHYVNLVGTFDANDKGHMSLASGSIRSITAVTTWPPRHVTPDH